MTCDHDLAERERAERAESEARLWLSEYNRLRQEIADATERCVAHLAERDALKAGCDVLRAELRSIGKALQDPQDNLTRTTAECIASLRAERDALRADAERYRWLRDEASPEWIGWADERDAAEATAPEVDAAIDRARGIQPGGQERSSVGRTDVVAGSSPADPVPPDPHAIDAAREEK